MKKHGIASIKKYNGKKDLHWMSNNSDVTPQQLYLAATYDLHEVVERIFIRYNYADTNGVFNEVVDVQNFGDLMKEQHHRKFGRCYTLSPVSRMRTLGIYYIKLQL